MALIERMSILGIRSFGPEHPQKIEFFTPVTLILGSNGTGKTTIIECLKYASTGELPAGSKTGCSFVQDPRISQETETKAKVTLQIRDIRGCPMIISRSLVATQRDNTKQGTLKTLDGSIKRQLPDGRVVSISSKCTELDREMVTNLGVSKAVLENVIFCHQEESNWPLQEAKAVKQRFDDLFASSRYVKALDAIRKSKQDKDGNVKIYKTELKHLTKNRDEAMKLRSEKNEVNTSIEQFDTQLQKIDSELEPINERLDSYKQKYAELVQIQAEIKSASTEECHLESMIKNVRSNISDEFLGTDEQLKACVDDSEAEFARKQLNLTKLESTFKANRARIVETENKISSLLVEQTQLEVAVNDKMAADEKAAQSSLDTCRTNVARFQQRIEVNTDSLNETKAEIDRITTQLNADKDITDRLESSRRELKEAEDFLVDDNLFTPTKIALADCPDQSNRLEKEQANLRHLTAQLDQLDGRVGELSDQLLVVQSESALNRDRDLLTKECHSKIEAGRKIRSRHIEALDRIFTSDPVPPVISHDSVASVVQDQLPIHSLASSRLGEAFRLRLSQLDSQTQQSGQRLAQMERAKSVLETKTKHSRSTLDEKKSSCKQLEDRILTVSDSLDLESSLTRVQRKRIQLENECANEQGSLHLWTKFRDRLAHPKTTDCPLCHRCWKSESERKELYAELTQRVESIPGELERKKTELNQLVGQYESLLELKPLSIELNQLTNSTIPQLTVSVNKSNVELDKLREQCDDECSQLAQLKADESLARSIYGDIAVLDKTESEVIDIVNKLLKLGPSATSDQDPNFMVESIQLELQTSRSSRSTLQAQSRASQQSIDKIAKSIDQAKSRVQQLTDQLYSLEQVSRKSLQLGDELTRLQGLSDRLVVQLHGDRAKLESNESDLLVAVADRQLVGRQRDELLDTCSAQVSRFKDARRQFDDARQNVESSCRKGNPPKTALISCNKDLDEMNSRLTALRDSTNGVESDLANAVKLVNEHKLRQRELSDCIQLRQFRLQLSQLQRHSQSLTSRLQALNDDQHSSDDLVTKTKTLTRQVEQITTKKQHISNELCQLQARLQYLDRDLSDKYANADGEYRDMIYQLKTTELACTDLERYYKALDRAILSYHSQKMQELNKIIRELWRSTYRGNDIDYIEICSEEERATQSISARRTYNYRVVMVKNTVNTGVGNRSNSTTDDTRLDMRGRCSAGQKVLASLIIRLALAEIFCLNCGVLALDEPTTNLDRENIESLAFALVE